MTLAAVKDQFDLPLTADDGIMRGRLDDVKKARQFIEAGRAIITVVSKTSGTRFTFKFSRPSEADAQLHNQAFGTRPIWVSVLSGPDNTSDFSFMGTIFPGRSTTEVRRSAKSRVTVEAKSFTGLEWFLRSLYGKNPEGLFDQAEVWHEGRCGRCGRRLTVPESIATGFGPDCIGRV